ncbi:hypothetical protein [Thioalkalivibrio sp.]|uniref:hypothetical protein n=1 Tax=Thioalkalivibrio sp. TaxID=2093813 RepID=UPI0035669E8E
MGPEVEAYVEDKLDGLVTIERLEAVVAELKAYKATLPEPTPPPEPTPVPTPIAPRPVPPTPTPAPVEPYEALPE